MDRSQSRVLKSILSGFGVLVALGFLSASALMNYLFGAALGRTQIEAYIYGAVSVLAVLFNALSLFFSLGDAQPVDLPPQLRPPASGFCVFRIR